MAHPICDALALLATAQERHLYKANVYRSWPNLAGKTFTPRRGVTVTLVEAPSIENGLLRFVFAVTVNGKSVPLDNPFFFHNPPILVPDPAGDVMRTAVDSKGVVSTFRYREDVLAALGTMVLDALKDAVK